MSPKATVFSMTLHDLLSNTAPLACAQDLRAEHICAAPRRDCRTIGAEDVFFCIRGTQFDGHTVIADAAARGACCAVIDDPSAISAADAASLPWVLLPDTAEAFLPACLAYHGHPERDMTLLAVTGTNGKTSVAYLLEAICSASPAHAPTACFGTVQYRIAGECRPSTHTTPAPEEIAEYLALARQKGVKTAVFEASSHALAQKRLSGLSFAVGIFTGLGEDHLDYHRDTEAYFHAKRSLFFACRHGVVNTDDAFGRSLLSDTALPAVMRGYSLDNTSLPADLLDTVCPFIAANRAAAAEAASLLGIDDVCIFDAIRAMPPIPGRMERICASPVTVYLDYAHTPQALYAALDGLKKTYPDRTISVLFGCGGDREHQKRPKMGHIAASLADTVVLTEDNSRTEDPEKILCDIISGISPRDLPRVTVIADRAAAIAHLISAAKPNDVLLLAGKGHETTQTDRSGSHPFSDRETALSCLQQKT